MSVIIIPVGPGDKPEWVRASLESALRQPVDKVIVYDNSERSDLSSLVDGLKSDKLERYKDKRFKKVNMAAIRNKMLSLTDDEFVIMLDSDVVIPSDWSKFLLSKLYDGVAFAWMHYAYSEEEVKRPLKPGETNPNLGCAGVNAKIVKSLGMFDERYERDEDVWLYSFLRKKGYRAEPAEGRCLHLNRVHAREDLRSSLKEARRNLWRSKYDLMLVFDGLTDPTFLTGYTYYGSYYILLLASIFEKYIALLYLPLIAYGVYYYGGAKKYFFNLIPGLALALSFPYGLAYNIVQKLKRTRGTTHAGGGI